MTYFMLYCGVCMLHVQTNIMGIPIKGYQANAIKNAFEFVPLADADVGINPGGKIG